MFVSAIAAVATAREDGARSVDADSAVLSFHLGLSSRVPREKDKENASGRGDSMLSRWLSFFSLSTLSISARPENNR